MDSRLKAIRAFFNWAIREELVDANPFRGVTVTIPDDELPVATDAQIESMLERARRSRNARRDVVLILLLADTGARKGELAAVERGDIDLTDGTIRFRVSKTKPRTVPLSDRCVVALGRWLKRRGVGPGSLWDVADGYSLVKQVCVRHSGGTVTPHQFRRRFAIEWLRKGGSENGLMRICGWSSREMIAVYSRGSADVLASDEMRRLLGS